jgi:hypothetical protein
MRKMKARAPKNALVAPAAVASIGSDMIVLPRDVHPLVEQIAMTVAIRQDRDHRHPEEPCEARRLEGRMLVRFAYGRPSRRAQERAPQGEV